jgi:glutamate synthase domain-containing protein 2
VSKDSDQTEAAPRKFTLGPLGNLNQVTKGLAKTIRAMAEGSLDSQVGARICNGLGIMRACLESQKLEQLQSRMDEIADRVARDKTNATRERAGNKDDELLWTGTDEAQRYPN